MPRKQSNPHKSSLILRWRSLSHIWLGLLCPWNSLGKNTGVSSLSLLQVSSQPSNQTQVSHIAGSVFTIWATREAQENWNGKPILSPGYLPDPGIELGFPALQVDSLPAELPGKPLILRATGSVREFKDKYWVQSKSKIPSQTCLLWILVSFHLKSDLDMQWNSARQQRQNK